MALSTGSDRLMWLLVIILVHPAVADTTSNYSVQDSVRWAISKFSPCSAECGGGVQVRTVRCIRSEHQHGRDKDAEVPESLCPRPTLPVTQSCNDHACTGYWAKGEWSECSETCGAGTQTREVNCLSSLWTNQHYQVSHSQCPGFPPETSRKCHVTDCPDSEKSETHSILSENYTLIQIHRAKKIKVNIGGQVKLLPGQTVVVKCPVKHYSKHLVYWSRGYRLVPFMGRVRSIPGGLHIDKADPKTDAGVYTCIAGDLTATITVQFIEKDDALTKNYKKWIQNSKRQQQIYNLNYKSNGVHKNVFTASANAGQEDLHQQRDESQNSTQVMMYVTQDWSRCNATCGSAGHQERNVTCSHVTKTYVKIIPDSECSYTGLVKPETTRECSTDVKCAVWLTGPWSKCRPSCGKTGYMNRILMCVWEQTSEPALTACDETKKPAVSKPCKTRPCPLECTDESRYCSLASLLKLCRYHHFRQQCCRTCEAPPTATVYDISYEPK